MDEGHPTIDGVDVDHRRIGTDPEAGVELHVAVAGPEDGDPVVLLHGFPDFWYGWRKQVPALVEAGYRVWIPDQRGYNASDAPAEVGAYDIDTLAEDALAVASEASSREVSLVAHDWGGGVGWWVGIEYPERVDRLAIINSPHPTVFQQFLRSDPRQLARSWYMLFFQLPWLPERLIRARNFRVGTAMLQAGTREGAFSRAELDEYRRAWSRPGRLRGMINWYRASLRERDVEPPEPHVAPPTALFWGTGDEALREAMARPSVDLCEDGRLVRFTGAGHWVHREAPETVNRLLVDFLDGEKLE